MSNKNSRSKDNHLKSEDRYKVLVKTSPDAVTVTDLEGNIIEVSQQTLDLHGFENEDELLGRNAFELIAPEDHEKAKLNLQKTLEEGPVKNLEYTLLRKDGGRRTENGYSEKITSCAYSPFTICSLLFQS